MDSMIANFLDADRAFYEKEFSFFNEVTDISGKLKPFIKKSKPEKKQKIEEELRKIKVEVGVYLPSNPDGQVIGIDRKSGKPLQSHAKAPYMATFRIRKEKGEVDNIEEKLEALEREEEKLEAEGFYDSEEDMVGFHPSSRLNFALFRSFSGTRMTSAKPQRWKSRKGNASTHKW